MAEWECKFAGLHWHPLRGSAVAVVWKKTTDCTPDVIERRYIRDDPGDVPTGIAAEAAAFRVTIGKTSHIVAAVSRARDVRWTDKFSHDLLKLMLEEKVRRMGVHSCGGYDLALAERATAIFANVVSVKVAMTPAMMPADYDATRAAVVGEVFNIAGSELSSYIHAPVNLMVFGRVVKDEANYKITGKQSERPLTNAWFSMMSCLSARRLDKLPLAKHGWRNNGLGPK